MGPPGVLAGFELYDVGSRVERRLSSVLLWIEPGGTWSEEERVVAARLAEAAAARPAAPDPARLRDALSLIAGAVHSRLALARGSRWTAPAADPSSHRVALRLHQGIREAARRRDLEALSGLERALAFVGRGHTAGESAELERLAGMPDGQFSRAVLHLPARAPGRTRWKRAWAGCCYSSRPDPCCIDSAMPKLRTVLFDLDGTLIDSVRLILDSYHHTLAAHGLPPRSDEEWLQGVGTPLTAQFGEWQDDRRDAGGDDRHLPGVQPEASRPDGDGLSRSRGRGARAQAGRARHRPRHQQEPARARCAGSRWRGSSR